MNARQFAKATMFNEVKLCFQKHYNDFKDIAPLKEAMDSFYPEFAEIEPLYQQQKQTSGSTTKTKEQLKQTAVDEVIVLAKRARPWAKKVDNKALIELFSVAKNDFKVEELAAVAEMNSIMQGIIANKASLVAYNIVDADMAAINTAITDFSTAIGTPLQQQNVQQIATSKIPVVIKNIDDILADADDLVEGNFAKTLPDAVQEYQKARQVASSVGQHTAVIAHIYADDAHTQPIAGAIISIDKLNRHDDSDIDGMAEIIKFKPGKYTLKITAAGYADKTIEFAVKSGKRVEVDVVMV